ncbi:MAG: hypothetical protein MUC60_14190 [Oscillatoria sp. Prado101]|nr:hypothetical protein [Oscillatoria sp. Prado101]
MVSGLSGAYLGGQITQASRRGQCQGVPWVFESVCTVVVTSAALWRGSTAGLWVGSILGAFAGGLATHKRTGERGDVRGEE